LRSVVDANIFVSAVLSPDGAGAQVLTAIEEGRIVVVTSEPLLTEIGTVLGRARFRQRGVTAATAAGLVALLLRGSVIVPIEGNLKLCRDPKDDMLIETSIRGNAAILASNDPDLHAPEVVNHLAPWGIRVLNVHGLLRELSTAAPAAEDAEEAAEKETDDGTS